MPITIYVHKNKTNGKCYVGQTSTKLIHRWYKEGKHYLDQPKFGNALRKYGWNGFEHIILEILNDNEEEKANELEIYYIKKFNSFEKGYNATTGGRKYFRHSEETRKKIGRTPSKETKEKISKALKGRKISQEAIEKTANKLRGRKRPKELIDKLLEGRKNYWNNGGVEIQREHAKGNKYRNKKVIVYDTFTETDQVFNSITDFCNEINIKPHTAISARYAQCKVLKRYYIEDIESAKALSTHTLI